MSDPAAISVTSRDIQSLFNRLYQARLEAIEDEDQRKEEKERLDKMSPWDLMEQIGLAAIPKPNPQVAQVGNNGLTPGEEDRDEDRTRQGGPPVQREHPGGRGENERLREGQGGRRQSQANSASGSLETDEATVTRREKAAK